MLRKVYNLRKIGQNYRVLISTFVCFSVAVTKSNILHINKHQTDFDIDDDKRVMQADDTTTLGREYF